MECIAQIDQLIRCIIFGYSREIYFWAFIVAILIFAVGSGFSVFEGIHKLLETNASY